MSDSYVVAWDKNGPIEVEMIVGTAGKKLAITGSTMIEVEETPKLTEPIQTKPLRFFGGRQWIT